MSPDAPAKPSAAATKVAPKAPASGSSPGKSVGRAPAGKPTTARAAAASGATLKVDNHVVHHPGRDGASKPAEEVAIPLLAATPKPSVPASVPAPRAPVPSAPARPAGEGNVQASEVAAILRARRDVHPTSAFASSLTLGWRTMLKIKHVPFQLFDVTITPIMFTLLFTYLFGGALADSPKDYAQYLLPGILVQTVVFITVYTGVSLNTDIQKGLFDRFRSLPIWQPSPIVGALLGDLVRYTVAGTIVVLVGLAVGFRPGGGVLGVLAAFGLLLLFCFSLSWMWIIVGLRMKAPETVMTMSFLLLFPLTFISNIFVQPATMAPWLRAIVEANPVTHLASAARSLMHGTGGAGGDVLWVVVSSAIITAVFMPIAIVLYRKER